jgi:hypothetical protein
LMHDRGLWGDQRQMILCRGKSQGGTLPAEHSTTTSQ